MVGERQEKTRNDRSAASRRSSGAVGKIILVGRVVPVGVEREDTEESIHPRCD